MPFKSDREYRSMTMSAVEGQEYKVHGYATTFDDPYVLWEDRDIVVREIIDHDALLNADMSDVIMQVNHEGRVFARNSNDTLSLVPDAHGLGVDAYLGGTDLGRGVFQDIAGGYMTKMSWAFTVDRDEWKSEQAPDGRSLETRTIKSVKKVYDVSVVSIPANDATEISARNLADGVIERVKAERLEAMKLEERRKALEEWFK